MFARNAHFRVKSLNLAADFAHTLENEVLPLLRQQKGFKGEITLSNPGNLERISISLWDNKSNAEAYDAHIYAQVLKMLSKVIDGKPKIRIFESVALNLDDTGGRQSS
jgi:phage terminase large subunit GpA-like protein